MGPMHYTIVSLAVVLTAELECKNAEEGQVY